MLVELRYFITERALRKSLILSKITNKARSFKSRPWGNQKSSEFINLYVLSNQFSNKVLRFGKIISRSRQSASSEQTGSVLGKIFAYGETKQFCLQMLLKIILPKAILKSLLNWLAITIYIFNCLKF